MTSRLRLTKKKGRPPNEQIENRGKSGQNVDGKNYEKMGTEGNKKIFQRAISNAQKHGLKLEPGRKNQGYGNCSYEAALFNINDRTCFKEKLPMSPDFYRRIWNTDMMNKIIYESNNWNPGLTEEELRQGFAELMESGIYERPFFGDMMMAGIACGIRKRILIFNTNEHTTHDPISVVDPAHYGGRIDSEIPVVVAYDLVHYESMHPVGSKDIDETVKLVNSYIAIPSRYVLEYGFTRSDMKDVLGIEVFTENKETNGTEQKGMEILKDEKSGFQFGSVLFEELSNGMVRC